MLSLAADAVEELSKENPSSEVVEYKTKDFLRTLQVCAYVHACMMCLCVYVHLHPCSHM